MLVVVLGAATAMPDGAGVGGTAAPPAQATAPFPTLPATAPVPTLPPSVPTPSEHTPTATITPLPSPSPTPSATATPTSTTTLLPAVHQAFLPRTHNGSPGEPEPAR